MICDKCKKEISEEFNFCPYCGTALSTKAKEFEADKADMYQLTLINNLIDIVEDKKTLKILKKISEELAK
jgi:predicted amidophosphoribosyltransferase